ncbi:MAG: A/G-specific adenine glycosylase [Mangrovimonas sp.]|nr:A/G-specific adenine glycosylase [Mangrovimonas sp.]MCB0435728.1 A/G-specific adenine glycosylase [Mangrovimonas sp.]
MIASKTLINWYSDNKRDLPWRNTKNPYYIWLSEIILQQTQVNQGLPYYYKFVNTYPTIEMLANASETDVLKLWQGLGYYSRARNLHYTAQYIARELHGVFPKSYKELIKLKGVGDYTASAIASICFNETAPVLDGNVYRVISRYYGLDTPINTGKAQKEFKEILFELIDKSNPAEFNQAIMEFGARQCKPQSPDCPVCPFNKGCYALAKNKVQELPVKLKPVKIKKRFFNYLVYVSEDGKTQLEKRTEKDIWQNLYQFPLIETKKRLSEYVLKEMVGELTPFKDLALFKDEVLHKLSHQHLYVKFWIVKVQKIKGEGINTSEVANFPVPILIGNFLDSFNF